MTLVSQKMYKALQKSIKHYEDDQILLDSGKVKKVKIGPNYCDCCLVSEFDDYNSDSTICHKRCAIGRSGHEYCNKIGYLEMLKSYKKTYENGSFTNLHRKVLKKLRSILRHCETRAMRKSKKS